MVLFPLQSQAETRNKVFAEKLETLLHRAYHLQEDFGTSIPTDSVLADFGKSHFVVLIGRIDACSHEGPCLRRANLEYQIVMCRFNETIMGHLKFTLICLSVDLLKWVRTSSKGRQLYGFVNSAGVFSSSSLAESEGTLILPQIESFHRLRDDDATTISSDDSFFSAADVSSVFSYKY